MFRKTSGQRSGLLGGMSADPHPYDYPGSAASGSVVFAPERPLSVRWAFALWLTLGVVSLPGGVGIFILLAAFSFRSGRRGGRWWLTCLGVFVLAGLLSLVLQMIGGAMSLVVLLGAVVGCSATGAAIWLMYHPDSNEWFREVRLLQSAVVKSPTAGE